MKDNRTHIALEDIGGIAEVAEVVDVSTGRVHQMLSEDGTFPRPVWHLKVGRIWDLSQVREWQANRDSPYAKAYRVSRDKRAEVEEVPRSAEDRAAKLDALLGKRF